MRHIGSREVIVFIIVFGLVQVYIKTTYKDDMYPTPQDDKLGQTLQTHLKQ
jgi:hypothetical protein